MTPHGSAQPVSPHNGGPGGTAAHPHPPGSRSGSQNRQRKKFWVIALTEEEEAIAMERQVGAGLSRSSYGRAALLGTPGPRARRAPTVHAQLLGHAIAALNRAGNVANQIAHRLNAAQTVGGSETRVALAEISDAARAIREAVGRKDRDDHQREQA
jgi:hypothetical protein